MIRITGSFGMDQVELKEITASKFYYPTFFYYLDSVLYY